MPCRASVKSPVWTYPLGLRRQGKRPRKVLPGDRFRLGWRDRRALHQAMENVGHFIQSVRIPSRTLLISVALLAGTGLMATPAVAEKRVALAIGNDLYPNLPADRQLRKAANDATTIAGDAEVARFRGHRRHQSWPPGDDRQACRVHRAAAAGRHGRAVLCRAWRGDRWRQLPDPERRAGRHRGRGGARARRLARRTRSDCGVAGKIGSGGVAGDRCLPRQSVPARRRPLDRQHAGTGRRQARPRHLHAVFRRYRPDRAGSAGRKRYTPTTLSSREYSPSS